MRQLGAIILGLWYACSLVGSLSQGIKMLAGRDSPPHYALEGLFWTLGVGVSSYFAGLYSRKHPVLIGVIAAFLGPTILFVLLIAVGDGPILRYRMDPLAFGWAPTVGAYFSTLSLAAVVAGAIGGFGASEELAGNSVKYDTGNSVTLGVRNGHWWWLWFPMSSWACAMPSAIYLLWLLVVSGVYWAWHPSLWFNWRWALFFSLGTLTTYLPYVFLSTGITESWDVLARGRDRGLSKWRIALRFLGWSYGCGFCAVWISVFIGEWVLSKLPLVSETKPWWVLF